MGYIIKNTQNIPQVRSVVFGNGKNDNNVPYTGGEYPIRVTGESGVKYKIRVEKKTSISDDSTVTAGYYNWSTFSFEAQSIPLSKYEDIGEITSGKKTHYISLPTVSADCRYDVYIDPFVDGVSAVLDPSIPTATGDFSIIQYGTRTFTLATQTAISARYGTLPANVTITRPKKFDGNRYGTLRPRPIFIEGGNGGVSSTRLVLNTQATNVVPNMLVIGAGIPHNTTVKEVKKDVITLSRSAAVANNTTMRFEPNNGALVPFSFTIVPNAGGNAINNTASADLKAAIGGLRRRVSVKTNGTTSSSKVITLDSTRGLLVGMILQTISKDDITYYEPGLTYGSENVTITAVSQDPSNPTIVVSHNLSLLVDDIEFDILGDPIDANSDPSVNSNVKILHITSDDSTVNVIITGYLDVQSVDATLTHPLYLEDIITYTA